MVYYMMHTLSHKKSGIQSKILKICGNGYSTKGTLI